MTNDLSPTLVLAIYPFRDGFAFVLFEGPANPFDWGVKEVKKRHKNAKILAAVKKIIDRYRPEVLVIEAMAVDGPRPGQLRHEAREVGDVGDRGVDRVRRRGDVLRVLVLHRSDGTPIQSRPYAACSRVVTPDRMLRMSAQRQSR